MAATQVNEKELRELFGQEKPVLVDYWAPWCSYCRRIGPAYDQIAEEFSQQVAVVKVNIDDEPGLAQGQGIEVIPTLVLYKGGQAEASVVAPGSKAAIEDFINGNL